MTRTHRRLQAGTLVLAVLVALVRWTDAALAQALPTEQVTPSGIPFQHIALPGDTHHALALGWVDGATHTEPGKEQLPAVSARLIMEGSKTLNESARTERLKDLQSSIGLSGGRIYTRALITAPPANFAEVAGLYSDMVTSPALPERKLVLARRNAEISWPQARENAETLAAQLFLRLTLGDGPLLRSVLGDPAAQSAISVADVEAWRNAVLGRRPVAIVSAGPLPADEIAREIDRMLAKLAPNAATPPTKPGLKAAGRLVVMERPAVQTAIVAGGPTGWKADADAVIGNLAVRVLGSGFDSRLTKAVREGLGATYGIRASLQQLHPDAFVLSIASQVDSTKAADTLAAVRREYARFREDGVTLAEIAPLRTRLVTEMREQFRRSSGAAQSLRDILLSGLPASYPARYADRVNGISVEAVNTGIRERMPGLPLTIVVVAPSAEGLGADCVIKSPDEIARCE